MFSGIFSLIILLLVVGSASTVDSPPLLQTDSLFAFASFFLVLPLFIACLFLQAKSKWMHKQGKDRFLLMVTVEWAIVLLLLIFFVGAHRLVFEYTEPFGQTVFTLFSFILYFVIVYLGVFWFENIWRGKEWSRSEAGSAVRFLIPFVIPFIILITVTDFTEMLSLKGWFSRLSSPNDSVIYAVAIGTAVAALFLIHPHLAVRLWRSPDLRDQGLLEKLQSLCKKAGFTYSGIKEWPIKNRSLTAAIIGIAGFSRYVLFSPKLLDVSSPDAICAILAHEIGHWRHRHLLIYPFILFEITAISLLAVSLIINLLEYTYGMVSTASGSVLETTIFQAASFVLLALIMGLFFRLIFGYFSRLFERQADIYPLALGLPVEHMVEALDTLAVAAGNIHNHPSWHHFSIRQRIDFLNQVKDNPQLIEAHHRKVRISLVVFFIAFLATLWALWKLNG